MGCLSRIKSIYAIVCSQTQTRPTFKYIKMLSFEYIHLYFAGDVDVFALNPSWVWTSIQSPMPEAIGLIPFLVCYPILYMLKCILAKTPKTGARTTIFCAVEPTL